MTGIVKVPCSGKPPDVFHVATRIWWISSKKTTDAIAKAWSTTQPNASDLSGPKRIETSSGMVHVVPCPPFSDCAFQSYLCTPIRRMDTDLLACGDIESNPGPRIRGHRKHAHQPCISIWDLNTRAGTAAWELLSLAADKQIPVVTMQEVRMFPNEVLACKRHAWNLGYVALHIAGPTLPVHRRGERTHGGVIALIKRSMPSHAACTCFCH